MPESSNEKTGLVKLGGLWVNVDRNGRKYLQGKMTYSARFLAFPNTFKKAGSSEPDYILYVAPVDNSQGGEQLEPDGLEQPEQGQLSGDFDDPFADEGETQPVQPPRRELSQQEYDNRTTRREYRGGQNVSINPHERITPRGTRR